MNTEIKIRRVCNDLAEFLAAKNKAYGDSALNPCRIFAKEVEADAQIRVRIDDKLNRLMKGTAFPGDNDVLDLAGYLVLSLVLADWIYREPGSHAAVSLEADRVKRADVKTVEACDQ
jgi:hypothetical protein